MTLLYIMSPWSRDSMSNKLLLVKCMLLCVTVMWRIWAGKIRLAAIPCIRARC